MERKEYEFKASALTEGEFEGIGNAFGNLDSYGDVTLPGAFSKTLKRFKQQGVLLYQHVPSMAIGKPIECREVDEGLYLKGRISETTLGKDVLTLLRDGVIRKMSIGYNVVRAEWFETTKAFREWAKGQGMEQRIDWSTLSDWKYGIRALAEIELWETSLVTFAANDRSDVTGVKATTGLAPEGIKSLCTIRDFEDYLREAGGLSRQQSQEFISRFKAALRDAGGEGSGDDSDTDDTDTDTDTDTEAAAEAFRALLATMRS